MRFLLLVLATLLLSGAACRKGAAPPEARVAPVAAARPPDAAARPADAAALPPDAGAMCQEHGVPEAMCTKCDPGLIPVFQARGDWCAAHGLPESVCPICNAPAAATPGTGPADSTHVRLATPETARMAGIETAPAVELGRDGGVTAVARIAYDARKVASVNARAAGVVREIVAEVGTRVRPGSPLARIESASVGAERSKLLAARARVGAAAADFRRAQDLHDRGLVPASEVLAAQQELESARAEQAAAAAELGMVGANETGEAADSAADGTAAASRYVLLAPLGGVVTERHVAVGQLVSANEVLFEIVDTRTMWAEIDVPETDLSAVAVGSQVTLVVEGLDGREFHGRIDYLAPAVDPRTRTALARVPLANPDGVLRANMYARARIATEKLRLGVAVPRSAVQRAGDAFLVFVRLGDADYVARRVEWSGGDGDLVELRGDVRPGELVVTTGSFLLKTETLKGSIGAGCCEPKRGEAR